MGKLIKEDIARAKKFHEIFGFIDDICALNDGGEFRKLYKEVYPKKLWGEGGVGVSGGRWSNYCIFVFGKSHFRL